MAGSWPTQLAILALNILLVVLFVMANTDFCGSVFETIVDHALVGHVMSKTDVADQFECHLKCLGNNSCKSFNVHPDGNNAKRICELNNKTRHMKPGHFKRKKGSTYYGSVQASCIDVSHERNGKTESGQCPPGYKGKKNEKPTRGLYSHLPARSCKDIRDSGDSKGDGEYWIDPQESGNPLKVFCDMTTDGGGWLLVSNYVIDSPSSRQQLSIEKTYRGIINYHNNKTFLTKSAMNELRTHLPFTQLQFHCSKQQRGRTFHVTTVTNSTGEAVVQYFSGQTDVQPDACGSFVRIKNDNSKAAKVCGTWGRENGVYNVGKWGRGENENRLYTFPVYNTGGYQWWIPDSVSTLPRCDDGAPSKLFGISSGDFWKVFAR